MKFRESKIAHKYLDGLKGLEIGGSAHNPFGLNTLNVDYTDSMDTIFKKAEVELCGEALKVDIVSEDGLHIPVPDKSYDFIISSHVIEHIFDPIAALKEWKRIVKNNGYILTIAPIREMVPGEDRPLTTFKELIERHTGILKPENIKMHEGQKVIKGNHGMPNTYVSEIVSNHETGHFTVFDFNLFIEIASFIGLKTILTMPHDDKVGNGFLVLNRV